ncbi:MAG TPA: RHS repeat-associated core domain-containing protein, partial [Urbifossiella sp.]|nr:RHS repeat-associated core domain-containing protein [Urbifossiella sp.]
ASTSQEDVTTVDALGGTVTSTDRNGSTHTVTYDALGRVVSDAVTTLGTGVDGSVRRIETAYDGQGNPYLITSYDSATGGSAVNQVERAYNGLGQLITEWQAASGSVNTSTTPKVQYAYDEMPSGADESRLETVTYPDGYVLTYHYASGLDATISRLSSLTDTTGTLEAYKYLGLDTVVERDHPESTLTLTYISQTGSTGDAGDEYTGLDRFGRVVDQYWFTLTTGIPSTAVTTGEEMYGYDADGNVLWRNEAVDTAFGELYSYDGLNQLASFARGTLNSTKTGITGTAGETESWDYDALGNWTGVDVNGTTQTRTANAQNEYTGVSGATTPGYDANGNMTQAETGVRYVYDAWNRLVAVKNSGGTTLETFGYDGLNRRVTSAAGGATTDLYYSADWQVVEERVGGAATARYVWSPVYVDALILRDRDTDANGSLDERLWVQLDANWNVTALVDGSGAVVERYVYDPYGAVTVLTPSFGSRSGSSYAWTQGFQGMFFNSISDLYGSRGRQGYSPTLGRWTSLDPIRFAGGDVNLYGFVAENPVNEVDPSGLQPPASPRCTDARTTSPGGGMNLSLRGFDPNPGSNLFRASPDPNPQPPAPASSGGGVNPHIVGGGLIAAGGTGLFATLPIIPKGQVPGNTSIAQMLGHRLIPEKWQMYPPGVRYPTPTPFLPSTTMTGKRVTYFARVTLPRLAFRATGVGLLFEGILLVSDGETPRPPGIPSDAVFTGRTNTAAGTIYEYRLPDGTVVEAEITRVNP